MPNKINKKKTKAKKVQPVKPKVLANNVSPRPVQRPVSRPVRKPHPRHVQAVCSVTDPFCPASKNSKWPDGTAGNTLTEQFRGNVTLTNGGQGTQLAVFTAGLPFGYNVSGAQTATNCTLSNAYTTYKTTSLLEQFGSNARMVSGGIIVRCVASATTAAGICTVGTATAPPVSSIITLGQELYQDVAIKAIQPGMELSAMFTPKGPGARDFNPQTTSTVPTTDWSAIFVEVTGSTISVPVINIEWFINVEFEPSTTNRTLAAIAKPNPPKSTVAESATSHIHSTVGSIIEGGVARVESVIADKASEALQSFMSDPLSSIASLFEML